MTYPLVGAERDGEGLWRVEKEIQIERRGER